MNDGVSSSTVRATRAAIAIVDEPAAHPAWRERRA
jgi:hypothetical protein